jgi:hypothetical protein
MSIPISVYNHIKETKTNAHIPLDIFFDRIKAGYWQDLVIPIRATQDDAKRKALKERLPNVTISGIFPERKDSECKAHSGCILIDIDKLTELNAVKAMLAHDPYVYAIFMSVSGHGLAVIFKIEPEKHRDAFYGICDYLIKKYQLPGIDPTSVNPSRARYVSYDPDLICNDQALIFKKYLPKEKAKNQIAAIFVKTEFEDIIRQMVERSVSCVEDYRDWLKVSFGLADEFGENGRSYFHSLSSCSNKYDVDMCNRQYNHALKRVGRSGIKVTISTIYYYAKQAGINVASETTKKISSATSTLKKAGLSKDDIIKNLEKFSGIDPAQSQGVVAQAFDSETDYSGKDNVIDDVLLFIKNDLSLRLNLITYKLENNGVPMEDIDLNSGFLRAKRVFKDITFDLYLRCLLSNNTVSYNPFLEWWEQNKDYPYNGEIEKLWSCVDTDSPEKLNEFGTKWLVGLISGIYGKASPLYFVPCGEGGKGKTGFFRHLLPAAWRSPVDYYAESKLDKGTDDNILMCQKLLIMDDEFGSQSKSEERKFKAMTDADTFSVRRPYGRSNVDMKRLAGLGATSNERNIISDATTENRRIIPILFNSVDYDTQNAIDRTAIFAELFRMYHAGFNWRVNGDDIARLNAGAEQFLNFSTEYELINEFFEMPGSLQYQEMTTSAIRTVLETTGQRTILNKIGQELKRMGFRQDIKKVNGITVRVWRVNRKQNGGLYLPAFVPIPDKQFDGIQGGLPF